MNDTVRLRRFLQTAFLFSLFAVLPAYAQQRWPGKTWERAQSPKSLGWSEKKLKAAAKLSQSIGSSAVMIVEGGVVVNEWGETATRYNLHSIRKSFLSALYGIHVQEGHIRLDKTMADLGIDDNPPSLTAAEKQATVRDLLKARSGIYHPALYETPRMAALRPPRGSHPPGAFWYYNNWDFNALGTIFEQQTRTSIYEAVKRRIAEPLEMEDFQLEDCKYFRGEQSIHPAYPMRMTARDMARFGLLYLRQGQWRGRQIVPKEWIKESTASYSDAGVAGGYGYMWWVAVAGKHFPGVEVEDGTFSARGAGGHYIVIIPKRDLVVVHRVNTDIADRQVKDTDFAGLLKMILDARRKRM